MNPADLLRLNLLSPVVLAFALGLLLTLLKSDLKFPDDLYAGLTIYLLLAIGLKGGAELAETPLADFWKPALATVAVGVLTPLLSFLVLRRLGRFDPINAAALAAHYGSVSVVTFMAAQAFLQALQVPAESFLATLVVLLEIPAILVGLLLAGPPKDRAHSWAEVLREVATGRGVVLLLGGLLIGLLAGKHGLDRVAPFFVAPFQGAVMLFLLEMGMVAARRLRDLKKVGHFLVAFAVVIPLVHGLLGAALGTAAGLSLGGTMILATLAASASYIAAPAAVRMALPQANPSYYLTASLGITFPFNLTVGIPIYYALARWLHG